MTAIREQLFAKIEDLLRADTAVQEIERMPASDPARFPALHLFDEGDDPDDEEEAGTSAWILAVRIEGYVEGGTGAAASAEANALYSEVVEKLMTEPVLGGLATEIHQGGVKPAVATLASKRRIGFEVTFSIHYATRRGLPQIV